LVEVEALEDLEVQVAEILRMPDCDVPVDAVVFFEIYPES
jgi:hypothetical protein